MWRKVSLSCTAPDVCSNGVRSQMERNFEGHNKHIYNLSLLSVILHDGCVLCDVRRIDYSLVLEPAPKVILYHQELFSYYFNYKVDFKANLNSEGGHFQNPLFLFPLIQHGISLHCPEDRLKYISENQSLVSWSSRQGGGGVQGFTDTLIEICFIANFALKSLIPLNFSHIPTKPS